VVRFKVKARVWLPLDASPPIHEDVIWKQLSFTRELQKGSKGWTGKVRASLVQLEDSDGKYLDKTLSAQATSPHKYALDEQDTKLLTTHTVNRVDKVVSVSVPVDTEPPKPSKAAPEPEARESIRIQSLIAQAGAKMGMAIWVPVSDRGGVLKEWQGEPPKLLDRLPLNYDTQHCARSSRLMFFGFEAARLSEPSR
jgi:hypothetical protein